MVQLQLQNLYRIIYTRALSMAKFFIKSSMSEYSRIQPKLTNKLFKHGLKQTNQKKGIKHYASNNRLRYL